MNDAGHHIGAKRCVLPKTLIKNFGQHLSCNQFNFKHIRPTKLPRPLISIIDHHCTQLWLNGGTEQNIVPRGIGNITGNLWLVHLILQHSTNLLKLVHEEKLSDSAAPLFHNCGLFLFFAACSVQVNLKLNKCVCE